MHLHSFCQGAAWAVARDVRPGRRTHRATALASVLLILAGLALPTAAQTPVAQYTPAAGPVGVALDTVAGTTYLYVADEAHGNVLKLNAATGATVATFGTGSQGSAPGQFGRPYGVAVDPVSHDLYVTERLNGRVQRVNSTTGASVLAWGTNDAAFNSSGQNTNPPNPTSPQGHFQEPIGVAADSAGNVYVVDHGNNRVQKFLVHQVAGAWTADNVAMWGTTGSGNGQFDHPYGAALDAAGNVWIADGLNGRVQKFTAAGAYVSTLGAKGTAAGQFVIATWVTFDASGAIYVTSTNSDPQATSAADINSQWVSKFAGDGVFASRFGGTYGSGPGEFKLPFGVAVDAANRAYVSDYYNSRVQVFDLATPPSAGGGGTGGGGTTDTTPPAIASFALGTSNATSVTYQLTFSEPVTGVDASDFTVAVSGTATASVGAVAGTGTTYSIPVTYSGSGTVQLSLKASGTGIADAGGNALAGGAAGPTYTIGAAPGGGGSGGGGGGSGPVTVVGATVPANGTYRAGDALVFKVKFSAPVFVKSAKDDGGKGKDSKSDDDDDDAEDGPSVTWSAAGDSGAAKYQSGSGTTELSFKYQVRGNDSAPQGIALGTTLGLPKGAMLVDASGHALTSVTIAWPQNPLPGVVLVRANESNHGADQRAGTPGGNGNKGKEARLVNLSSRMKIKGGDASRASAVGFVVSGSAPQSLLIRAVGPSLRAYGVMDALSDPTLTIRASSGQVIASNDGWKNDATIVAAGQRVGAFALATGSRDSALVVTLAPGAYTALVGGATANGVALVEVYDAGDAATAATQLANISTRGYVEPGADLIAGFVVSGTTPKRVLVRAIGPALAAFGVSGALADPVLEVRDSAGVAVARNDNWSTPVAVDATHAPAAATDILAGNSTAGAFPLSSGSRDAALIVTLAPGAYSAVVTGAGGASGATLVEVYELPSP